MNFDFSALLVFLTFVSGLIWLVDRLFFANGRKAAFLAAKAETEGKAQVADKDAGTRPKLPMIVEYSKSFFPVFLAVLLLRSFLFEPFKIPSASMMPTLLIGDFILVNKYDYGLRLPVLHNKFVANKTPARGDIVVFRYPEDPDIPFIKRVVGLPGDKIAYYNKTLYINDAPVPQDDNGRYNAVGAGYRMDGMSLKSEQLGPGGHAILVDPGRPSIALEIRVPEGHYYVLGDNRDNSKDSRAWGFVPDENLVGRAFMIWMNWDSKNGGVNFSRIGTIIE